MDVFEVGQYRNNKLDDTQKVVCFIESIQNVNGHTEYVLRFQRGPSKDNSWRLLKRYNDFVELHKHFSKSAPSLPGKRLYGNMRPEFIAERRQALQVYINSILMNLILASSLPAKRFVDPDNYSQSFQDQATQNVLLSLRHDNLWTLGKSLGSIGWRLRKHYFKVTPKSSECKPSNRLLMKTSSHSLHNINKINNDDNNVASTNNTSSIRMNKIEDVDLVLEWCEYGPDKYIEDKELGKILKSLTCIQHPNVEPIIYASHNENGCLVIRKFYKHGSLKDTLYMATPKSTFLNKYSNPKRRVPLSIKQVATYGIQILEGLIFLHSKGLPYGHLHSGNVLIVNNCAKLLDVENYLIGVPAFYRPFFLQQSKIYTSESIDVYSFGHVLFEMAMGYPLQDSIIHEIPQGPEFPASFKDILGSILSREACKTGLPTLEQLLQHKFFEEFVDNSMPTTSALEGTIKPYLKFTLNAKEIIKEAKKKTEVRLKEEQKAIKSQKRIVRVQGLMSFEEEKRKYKQKEKVESKQVKLRQQYSLQTNSEVVHSSLATNTTDTNNTKSPDVYMKHSTNSKEIKVSKAPLTPIRLNDSSTRECQEQQKQKQLSDSRQSTTLSKPTPTPTPTPTLTSLSECQSTDATSLCNDLERSALLESICKFNRGSLRKIRSND